MALADYYLCDVCECKCFYDANLNWDIDNPDPVTGRLALDRMGDMAAICTDCAKTHEVVVREKIIESCKGEKS